jgi:hypothetical protein
MKWETVSLGDVLHSIIGGGTPSKSKSEYWNGDIFWCSVKDMEDDKHYLSYTKDTITKKGLENSSANLIKAGTVITSTRMGLGRAFINKVDMAINQDLKALIPNERIDNRFLLWTILSKRNELNMLGRGSTVKGITLDILKSIEISLPPLIVQRRIADILSAYDDLIDNNQKQIKLLEEAAMRLYTEWFVNLRFPGHENTKIVDGVPEGWRLGRVSELAEFKRGKTITKKNAKYGGPLVLVDFGTATTFCAVSENAEYLGGSIAPGIKISSDALFEKTSKLPKVELEKPGKVICRNTIESMQSGLVYGHMGMVDFIIKKMKKELMEFSKTGKTPTVVATGGLANLINSGIDSIDYVDKLLTLEGLEMIYRKNKGRWK